MIPKNNKKIRPLGIPTVLDRCVQALYLQALEPIAETVGEERSYGFRKNRSTQDVQQYIKTILSKRDSARFILDADIKGFFDNISHEWILENIPMNKYILKQWLENGYVLNNKYMETFEGVPQGGIISPVIANMVLDGLGNLIKLIAKKIEKEENATLRKNKLPAYYSSKIHYVRYADDFLITADRREYFEIIIPEIEKYLAIRGVELNKEKTKIFKIENGFDFVGFNFRKYKTTSRTYGEIFIIKPTKKNIQKFKDTIKKIFKVIKIPLLLIKELNPILRGWGNYYQFANSARIFGKLDFYIVNKLINWIRKIQRRRGMKKAIKKYFKKEGNRKWNYQLEFKGKIFRLFRLSSIKIGRYVLTRNLNPFLKENNTYYENRLLKEWNNTISDFLLKLIRKQKGICPVCKCTLKMLREEDLEVHHIQPREFQGNQRIKNLLLLHKTCHQSVTNCTNPELLAKYVSEGIIKPLSKRYKNLIDKKDNK